MKVNRFINNVLIGEFKDIQQKHGHHYVSFSLIGLGIELLGACLDKHDFEKKFQSERRFRIAIKKLFPPQYHIYNDGRRGTDLYKHLRCGFAHQFRLGKRVALTHRAESKREKTKHLSHYKGRLVLVAEDLFEDFKEACKKVIGKIDSGKIKHKKVQDEFLVTRF